MPPAPLNTLARGAQRSGAPRILSAGQASRLPPHAQPKYLLLRDIPRTAIPSDILRALKDSGAVDSSFSVSAITGPPPSLPRAPSLYKTWHLTLSTPQQALAIHQQLNNRPLFSSSSNLPSSRARESHTFGTDGTIAPQSCQLLDAPSDRWVGDMITRSVAEMAPREPAQTQGQGQAPHRTRSRHVDPEIDLDWALRSKSGMSGRRVVITGLPGSIRDEDVRKLGKDCGVVDGDEGLKKLPPSRYALVSTYCLTTNSVSDAHRLVRKLHMRWYKSILYGEKYLMRAEIVY